MRLTGLRVGDDPDAWASVGFAVRDGVVTAGGVAIGLGAGADGSGITGWHVDGLESRALPAADAPGAGAGEETHPNGVLGVDHVVAFCGDFDATVAALAADGLTARRIREAGGGVRQAFYLLETALLELAGPVEGYDTPRLWGITFVVDDLDALKTQLGDLSSEPRDAVQPGRRILSLRREAGLSVPLAFMTPR